MMSQWHLRLCGTLSCGLVSGFEIPLDIVYDSQSTLSSFMVILGSLDPHYFNHSRHVFIEIDFVENNSNSQIIACFVMCLLSLNLHFPHPISYATYWVFSSSYPLIVLQIGKHGHSSWAAVFVSNTLCHGGLWIW